MSAGSVRAIWAIQGRFLRTCPQPDSADSSVGKRLTCVGLLPTRKHVPRSRRGTCFLPPHSRHRRDFYLRSYVPDKDGVANNHSRLHIFQPAVFTITSKRFLIISCRDGDISSLRVINQKFLLGSVAAPSHPEKSIFQIICLIGPAEVVEVNALDVIFLRPIGEAL